MDRPLKELLEVARIIAMERSPYWMTEISALVWVQSTPAVEAFFAAQGVDFTMAVTGDWVAIASPKIVGQWSPAETATIVTHELMHLWQKHEARAQLLGVSGEDMATWGIAVDLEINDDLDAAGWPFPKTHPGVRPSDYGFPTGLLAEQYFDLLLRLPRDKRPRSNGVKGSTGGANSKNPAAGQGACGSASGVPSPVEDLMDLPHPNRDEAEQEETLATMAASLDEYASKNPGKVPAGLALDAKRMRKRSKVDWKPHLRSAVRTAVSSWVQGEGQANWARLARRQFADFIRPSQRQPTPLVAVVRDTSGSMVGLLEKMYPEIDAVLQVPARRCSCLTWTARLTTSAPCATSPRRRSTGCRAAAGPRSCPPSRSSWRCPSTSGRASSSTSPTATATRRSSPRRA